MTNEPVDNVAQASAPLKRLTHRLFVFGVVGTICLFFWRYSSQPAPPKLEIGQTYNLRPWGWKSLVVARDRTTLERVMFADCEDLVLPIASVKRQTDAGKALLDAVETGGALEAGEPTDEVEVKLLDRAAWDPQYSGRLLDTPEMLKVVIGSGKLAGREGWISSHWIAAAPGMAAIPGSPSSTGNSLERIGRWIALVLAIVLGIVVVARGWLVFNEWRTFRNRFRSIPFTLLLAMARYRLSAYRGMFFGYCILTVVIGVPKAFTDSDLPGEYLAFMLALGGLSVVILAHDTLPPAAIVLGGSTLKNVQCFVDLERHLRPLRCTCLLTAKEGLDMTLARLLAKHGLRLARSPHWRMPVTHLIDAAPIVVFLGNDDTEAVKEEQAFVRELGYEPKCAMAPAADASDALPRISQLLAETTHQVKLGHARAWKWIAATPFLSLLGLKNTALDEGRSVMLKALRECGWDDSGSATPFLQSLKDFPQHLFGRILHQGEGIRGLWHVRAIFRGLIDDEKHSHTHNPQTLAIAHAMLARAEALAGDFSRAGDHARAALTVIEKTICATGQASLADIELGEVASLHLCLAESLIAQPESSGDDELRGEVARHWGLAASDYEKLGIDLGELATHHAEW